MLSRIEVSNFQSLRRARIPLGKFTVITGPTGSGKSALFRAFLTLVRNARGTSYISTGETSCTIATGNETWAVRLTRSRAPRGKNEYVAARTGGQGWETARYTKLGGQVPDPVAEQLGLSELNFAQQFDPPYLLAAPPTEIARRLGDLTNVSLVFNAAAAANRVRKQLSRDLDGARSRRDALLVQAQEFAGLRERRTAIAEAEVAVARAQDTAAALERLRALADRLEAAERTAGAARAEAESQAPPSLERLETLANEIERLKLLAAELEAAGLEGLACARSRDKALLDEQRAHEAIHEALAAAGQCPTCGREVAA